jgi:hypothetical protein
VESSASIEGVVQADVQSKVVDVEGIGEDSGNASWSI